MNVQITRGLGGSSGCHDATHHEEISEQGYPGAYQNVWHITRYLEERERSKQPAPGRPPGICANRAAGILVKRAENRAEGELRTLQKPKKAHQTTEQCRTSFEGIAGMLGDKEQAS
jgi:hypothetical protein